MKIKIISTIIILFTLSYSANYGQMKIQYFENDKVISNPERGLFSYGGESIDHSKNCWENDEDGFDGFKLKLTEAVKKKVTLIYLQYDLGEFRNQPKPNDKFYECLQKDFAEVRASGLKVVLRFSYNPRKLDGSYDDFDGDEANPFEAKLTTVLAHLDDLKQKKIIEQNADVIAVWQAGSLGKYGEWYYTADDVGVQENSKMNERVKVLKKMLEILPKPTFIKVRTPYYKKYAISYLPNMTDADKAVIEDFKQRIGIFDDSFFDDNKYGTFSNYGPNNGESRLDWENYLINQDKRVPVGGETSGFVRVSTPEGEADKKKVFDEFAKFHWSFFNEAKVSAKIYNDGKFVMDWRTLRNDSETRLERHLGYRIILTDAAYEKEIAAGNKLLIKFKFKNVGWAAPIYNRKVEVFACKKTDKPCRNEGKGFVLEGNVDIREWFPNVPMDVSVELPTVNLSSGDYDLFLNLPDFKLINRKEYSIRLANSPDGKIDGQAVTNIFAWTDESYNRFGSLKIK